MGSTQPREYNWGTTWKKKQRLPSKNREYGPRDPSRSPRGTLFPQKLALTASRSGGHSVSIILSRTQATIFSFLRKVRAVKLEKLSSRNVFDAVNRYSVVWELEHTNSYKNGITLKCSCNCFVCFSVSIANECTFFFYCINWAQWKLHMRKMNRSRLRYN
jgi:hypothetical protein